MSRSAEDGIDRRPFIAAILAAPLLAKVQPAAARVWTVGMLASTGERARAFEEGLREFGWVDGTTIRLERRFSVDYRGFAGLVGELVRLPADVIFAGNAPAARAALDATRTIPIVVVSGDPVSAGLVASLARPGGNVTGLAIMNPELSGKRLELLTEAVPSAKRVAVLANPANPSTPAMVRESDTRARTLGLQLVRVEATTPEHFTGALGKAVHEGAQALVVLADPMFFVNRGRLLDLTARYRLPAVWEWRDFAEAGGLMAYAPRLEDLYRRAAGYVDRILRGTKPGDLPIEQPRKFELMINLKTAKALGLTIPQSIVARADQIIQ